MEKSSESEGGGKGASWRSGRRAERGLSGRRTEKGQCGPNLEVCAEGAFPWVGGGTQHAMLARVGDRPGTQEVAGTSERVHGGRTVSSLRGDIFKSWGKRLLGAVDGRVTGRKRTGSGE